MKTKMYKLRIALMITLANLLISSSIFAQAPQKMSYQAVIRNTSNALITSTPIGMQISILQGSSTGTAVYVETQTPTTNANGLVSLEIGTGTIVTGTFVGINWATGPYFIKTETDPLGGTAYTIAGTNELMSVPYALFSANGTPGADGALNAWSLTGSASTVDGTNFIGTTDNIPFNIKVNNQKAGRIDVFTAGNTFFGYQSGDVNFGNNFNTGIGQQALFSNTTGSNNTANGSGALYYNNTGNGNTANGVGALYNNTTGNYNTASGRSALYNNTTGTSNTANGFVALYSNTTGTDNTANGYQALNANTTGSNNTANGREALYSNTTGNGNTANGVGALYYNTTGNFNTASGRSALYNNTTGTSNTANGFVALFSNTEGNNNTANGRNALYNNTIGNNNTANGHYALFSSTEGNNNTANGHYALYSNTTGNYNTANGYYALLSNTEGNNNTANGYFALLSNTTGNNNTANGYQALNANTTGTENTAIGYNADVFSGALTNATAIGANATVNANNKIRLGDAAVTVCEVPVVWTVVSDKNLKTDIKYDIVGLNFIKKLEPASYKYIAHGADATRFTGLLAQDVDAVLQKLGIESSIVTKPNADGTGSWGIRYAELTIPLIKAVQELDAKMEAQQKMIEELLKITSQQQQQIDALKK